MIRQSPIDLESDKGVLINERGRSNGAEKPGVR